MRPDFQSLAENVPVLMVCLGGGGELQWGNEHWRSYTGLEAYPASLVSTVHEEQHAALEKLLERMQAAPRQMSCELQLRRKDENYRWFQLLLAPCLQDEKLFGVVGALFDLTDVRMIEEQMMELNDSLEMMVDEQTRHLKEANEELKATQSQMLQNEKMASIGQLAAGVAHEINNPMGFIASNINSLAKYLTKIDEFLQAQQKLLKHCATEKDLDELQGLRKRLKLDYLIDDSRDLIEESLEGAERVQKIVLDLKSFSRVDRAEVQSADLNDCMESTLGIVWNELKYKVTLEKNYGELTPIFCLPQQLNQVFLNILVNGAQAIETRGIIRIKTWQDERNQYVEISDDGCGIPDRIREKIFEPFFTTKEVGKGTGLGMSISYDIVKKHGGDIRISSEPGAGSTFTIVLPRCGIAPQETVA